MEPTSSPKPQKYLRQWKENGGSCKEKEEKKEAGKKKKRREEREEPLAGVAPLAILSPLHQSLECPHTTQPRTTTVEAHCCQKRTAKA